MRGEPGDAMARMKRWDAVRQRLAGANAGSDQIVEEVVRAVGEVIQQHPDALTVTVTVDDAGALATIRIVQRQGQLEITRLQPQPLPPPPLAGGPSYDPHSLPVAGRRPAPAPPAPPPPVAAPPPVARPAWPQREAETLDQTAARLAELIRQDPSLLEGP
jgi:hypothetical protein